MKTVLIADDELLILDFLEEVLSEEGFRVVSTDKATEVLRLFLREHPDVVIIDNLLGPTTGIDICRQIYERAESDGIPIVVMSAYPYLDLDGCPAVTVLPKPFSIEEIQSVMRRLVPATTPSKPSSTQLKRSARD